MSIAPKVRNRSVVVLMTLLLVFLTPAFGGAKEVRDPEAFRVTLLDFLAATYERYDGWIDTAELFHLIEALPTEAIEALDSGIPDRELFERGVEAMLNWTPDVTTEDSANRSNVVISPSPDPQGLHAAATSFSPDYPSGGGYAVFTATLPGLGLLDFGPTNRTDAAAVGDTWIVLEALILLEIAAQAACDGGLLASPALCILAAAARVATAATQIVIDQTSYQDGLIDGAEIEATFENTKRLIDHNNGISTDLGNHDTAISNQLTIHNTDISSQLGTHDTDISSQLTTHDTDIKALLGTQQFTLDNKVEHKRVHLNVVRVHDKRAYLVSATEAGVLVDVDFLSILVSDKSPISFLDVTGSTTITPVGTGLFLIALPKDPKKQDLISISVKHDDIVDHFGHTVFHHDLKKTLAMLTSTVE